MAAKRWNPDEHKLKELILYVSQQCASHPRFGAVKLNMILFYSDFLAYLRLGEPITGVEYQKLEQGPAPKRMLSIQDQMKQDGELAIQVVPSWNGEEQHRPVNLRRPNLKLFTADQISLVDSIIAWCKGRNAETLSGFRHQQIGWESAQLGETIPYSTVFLVARSPNGSDIIRGREAARQHNELLASIA
jgi:hypothetical protein